MTTLFEKIVSDLDGTGRWRAYQARVQALPAGSRTASEALERHLTYFGMITKEDAPMGVVMSMLEGERGIDKERARLVNAIERAEAQDGWSRS